MKISAAAAWVKWICSFLRSEQTTTKNAFPCSQKGRDLFSPLLSDCPKNERLYLYTRAPPNVGSDAPVLSRRIVVKHSNFGFTQVEQTGRKFDLLSAAAFNQIKSCVLWSIQMKPNLYYEKFLRTPKGTKILLCLNFVLFTKNGSFFIRNLVNKNQTYYFHFCFKRNFVENLVRMLLL